MKDHLRKEDSLLLTPGTKEWLEVQSLKDKQPPLISKLEAQEDKNNFLNSAAPATKPSNTTRKTVLANHLRGLLRWYFESSIFPPTKCKDELTIDKVGGWINYIANSDIFDPHELDSLDAKAKEDAFSAATKYFNEYPTDADAEKFFQIYPECRGNSGPLSSTLVHELAHRAWEQWENTGLCEEDLAAGGTGCGCKHAENAA
jgi:hypothetical protein